MFKSNLHTESRPLIINPTSATVVENLHKIGLLDSSSIVSTILTPYVTCVTLIDCDEKLI